MNKKLFVLVVDDNQADAEHNIKLLRSAGYDISYQRVETADQMREALDYEPWDLILSEYSMAVFTVQNAFEIFQAHGADIPFIVISGAIGEVKAVQLIKAGVHDYLLKANMTRFIPVVERELQQAHNRRELINVSSRLTFIEEIHKSYVENAPDGVFITDLSGNYIEVNKAACRITGYSKDELLTMCVKDLVPEDLKEVVSHELRGLMKSGSITGDFQVKRKDGLIRWFAVDAIQVSQNQFLGFTKDITDQKQANLEVLKAREELQQLNRYLVDARENERGKVAMEIHDELGQALTAIKIDLNWVLEHISDSAKSFQKVSRIIEMTDDTIRKVQKISSELRPGLLDDLGLATAIEWYCGEFEQRTGIKCQLAIEDVTNADEQVNLSLFRIFQEAMTNVVRHSQAKTVNIKLVYAPTGINMIIEDDGIGLSQEKVKCGKSMGLIGMRERANQINGTVEFSKSARTGTKIVTFIPFQPQIVN
ncbi:MAG: PAS domain S-box protein [Bacteroidales bacterium]|nr:PAS domain S-box protein [Bacteroidales bacterium]